MNLLQNTFTPNLTPERKIYMATITERIPQNAPGRFYVDLTCIDCDQCRATAPDFFHRNADIGMSVVCRQPRTLDEFQQAREALAGCPTESIGEDPNYT